jgi:Tol biopolymer transport system component
MRPSLVAAIIGLTACAGPPTADDSTVEAPPTPAARTYLGLEAPAAEAVIFAPGVVSKTGTYEYALSIHPSMNQLLYTVEAPNEGAAVYRIRIGDGGWSAPEKLDLTAGEHTNEMEAFFAPDDARIFFAPFSEGMDVRIWSAGLTPNGFTDASPLEGPIADYPTFFPVQAPDGFLYHTNLAERTVFRATLDGVRVSATEDVGLGQVGHAYPSPDGSFLLVDSASLDTEGQRDIMVSYRTNDGGWGEPRPLGPAINTGYSESCPTLSPDGAFLFFSRYDEPEGISNIYWISSETIPRPGVKG